MNALLSIPAELRALPQWCRWKRVPDEPKPRKIPVRPSDPGCASSTDPATWGSFEDASAHVGQHGTCGLGFAFAPPHFGGDLDNCVVNRVVTERAKAIVAGFATYTEISPSGEGLHIIGRGSLKGHGGLNKKKEYGIELYDCKRFFTMTGQHLMGTSLEITDGQAALDALVARLDPPRKVSPPPPPRARTSDDHGRIVERARAYVAKMPAAISGQGGHEATFRVALALVRGFSLDTGTALDLLRDFNARCEPPWSEKDLEHKVDDAGKADVPDGYILERDEPKAPRPAHAPGGQPAATGAEPKDQGETTATHAEAPAESSPAEIIRRRGALNCERHATGIAPLDAKLSGGLPAGRSLYIVAPMESGKTSLAVFMAHNLMMNGLHVGGLFPDEGRDAASVRLGQIFGLERDLLERGDLETANRFAASLAGCSVDFMETDSEEATIDALLRRGAERSPKRVFANIVDSLQRGQLEAEKPGADLRLKVRANARACARGGGPRSIVIATAQANRSSYAAREEKDRVRPEAAGAESSEIEFAADVQLFLEAIPNSDIIRVTITKNRVGFRGEKGCFHLRMDRARASYSVAPEEEVVSLVAQRLAAADEQRAEETERREDAQAEKAEARVRKVFAERATRGVLELPAAEIRRAMRVGSNLNRVLLRRWAEDWLHGRKDGRSKLFHLVPPGKEQGGAGCCPEVSAAAPLSRRELKTAHLPLTVSSPLTKEGEDNVRQGAGQSFVPLSGTVSRELQDSEDNIAGEPDEETV